MGQRSISIPIPVFAYQIYTLTSDNFGYFNRNDSITKILRRLIFLSFLPRKGEQDLFLFKISVFFFFLISPIFLRPLFIEERKTKTPNENSTLRGLKYYSLRYVLLNFNSNVAIFAIEHGTDVRVYREIQTRNSLYQIVSHSIGSYRTCI